jgi:hypothetical protein
LSLWAIQIYQMFLVTLSPGIFAALSFLSIKNLGQNHASFHWMVYQFVPHVNFVALWAVSYILLHGWWTINAYRADRGKISESVCWSVAGCTFVYMVPIYSVIWLSEFTGDRGVTPVGGLILATMFLPGLLAGMEDLQSLLLYMLYLPWFLVFSLFFLVYFPSYSFARLYDTTWGNRETGAGKWLRACWRRLYSGVPRNLIVSPPLQICLSQTRRCRRGRRRPCGSGRDCSSRTC